MQIKFVNSYNELSRIANENVMQLLEAKPDLLLCAATGNSPTGVYKMLAENYHNTPERFSKMRVIKLDEWGGIEPEEKGSCETYLQEHVLRPLQISGKRYIGFKSNPENPQEECNRISSFLAEEGPIDLCILGLGSNGHLALNEPAEFLQAQCHVTELSPSSLKHKMTSGMKQKPSYGLTLGMADILHSKNILILITGSGKSEMAQQLMRGKINSQLPASFLWLHPNTICLIDRESINL
ncbi:MAG TPA: galactosamine-6-phosphate isomerase [Draconibacterium sp.]|nr:galactosamine-6-phosphate isomerase [Draconibacterium sp.]